MNHTHSYIDFYTKTKNKEKTFLLLYKSGSPQSDCAFHNLQITIAEKVEIPVYFANVNEVRDIHSHYQITSVPSFLIFDNGNLSTVIKGCQESNFYKSLLENAVYHAKAKAEGKTPKHVTVYSTPSCSWCNTLKSWLRKNNIPFADIDVSRNENAARELVQRTGQQGVPQTEINGKFVIGFDQQKLKNLLEI